MMLKRFSVSSSFSIRVDELTDFMNVCHAITSVRFVNEEIQGQFFGC